MRDNMLRKTSATIVVIGFVLASGFRLIPGTCMAADKFDGNRVIAIDVLLLPDTKMKERAEAANARLRENYPQGYTLGKRQVAHISLVHCYVREKDVPAIEATVSNLVEAAQPLKWTLVANGYSYAIWSGVAITTIGVDRTRQLDEFQEKIAKAAGHYTIAGGTAAAFSTNSELPKIDPDIVDYVEKFAENSSDKKYSPHVTVGVAHENFVRGLKAEAFEAFSFKPAGVAIYQLGNFGTAQKKLWEWWTKETPAR